VAPGQWRGHILRALTTTLYDRIDMSVFLFHAHSGLRYIVLLSGFAAFGYCLYAALRNVPWNRGAQVLLSIFVGVLDLQVLLGLILVFVWRFYPALWGHIVLMVLAAAVAHLTSIVNRRRPVERRSHLTAALGVAGALILVVGGITAIGRPVL
jgi:hypothetical protein